MKKLLTVLALAMPLTACDRVSRDDAQALKNENVRLTQENQELKVQLAHLQERVKLASAKPAGVATAPAKTGKKPVAGKAPDQASPAEKAELQETVTGGGSFK